MHQEEITALFDQQAAAYDQQWSRMAPVNGALHLLTAAVLSELPPEAHILIVGAGTGAEILYLAEKFPGWRFTAVEPAVAMLEVFRRKAQERGIAERCVFHAGYLDSLPAVGVSFDAATAFLVSQFILDQSQRAWFFRSIADRLAPHGILVSSDLAGDLEDSGCRRLLKVWVRLMRGSGVSSEDLDKILQAYRRDVAILPPDAVRGILIQGGFESPVPFFQTGLIHGWYAQCSAGILPDPLR